MPRCWRRSTACRAKRRQTTEGKDWTIGAKDIEIIETGVLGQDVPVSAAARFGDDYRAGIRSTGAGADRWEVTFELTYRVRVLPFLSLQPDVQYVANPGGDPDLDDALVVGLRAVLFF